MVRKLLKGVVALGMLGSLVVPLAASAHEHRDERDGDRYGGWRGEREGDRDGWRAEREHERRERWEQRRWRHEAYERYFQAGPSVVYYGSPYGYR